MIFNVVKLMKKWLRMDEYYLIGWRDCRTRLRISNICCLQLSNTAYPVNLRITG